MAPVVIYETVVLHLRDKRLEQPSGQATQDNSIGECNDGLPKLVNTRQATNWSSIAKQRAKNFGCSTQHHARLEAATRCVIADRSQPFGSIHAGRIVLHGLRRSVQPLGRKCSESRRTRHARCEACRFGDVPTGSWHDQSYVCHSWSQSLGRHVWPRPFDW